jgi:3-oxoacyl-[acyl-carrier-protein] synthase III
MTTANDLAVRRALEGGRSCRWSLFRQPEPAQGTAGEHARQQPEEMELVVVSYPTYDHGTPPTSALLQERLNIPNCAEIEVHSNCAGVGKSVQIAFDALRTGRYRTALVTYSQLSSMFLRGCYLNQPKMDRVHAAMRWILADGAGALVLEARPDGNTEHEILGTFTESVGPGRPPSMTAGAHLIKASCQIPQMYDKAGYHLWQDFAATNRDAGPLLLDALCKFTKQLGINSDSVDHYVLSIPTIQFYNSQFDTFMSRLGITREQGKFRGVNTGYCGGASIRLHLDEMIRNGELKAGQTAIVHSVESSKWMSAGFALKMVISASDGTMEGRIARRTQVKKQPRPRTTKLGEEKVPTRVACLPDGGIGGLGMPGAPLQSGHSHRLVVLPGAWGNLERPT